MGKKHDYVDFMLGVGALGDWITPVEGELRGYTTLEYSTNSYESAIAYAVGLRQRGVKCRVEGSLITGYAVYSKRGRGLFDKLWTCLVWVVFLTIVGTIAIAYFKPDLYYAMLEFAKGLIK